MAGVPGQRRTVAGGIRGLLGFIRQYGFEEALRADLLRDGLSLDDLGRQFSWVDLQAYIKFSRPDSALAYVNENPPVDPSTVPTKGTLTSIKDRLAAKRAELRDAESQVVTHNRRDRKRAASS